MNVSGTEFHRGTIDLKLGNRFFVTSFLENIFGVENISSSPRGNYVHDGAQNVANRKFPLTVEYILSKRDLWGGPCDIYDMSENDQGNLEFPLRDCHRQGGNINPSLVGLPNIIREGFRVKSCEEILNLNAAITHALNKVDLQENAEGSLENITKVYSLFFPTRNTNSALARDSFESMQQVFNAADSSLEGWRHVLLTLCFDPSWQII